MWGLTEFLLDSILLPGRTHAVTCLLTERKPIMFRDSWGFLPAPGRPTDRMLEKGMRDLPDYLFLFSHLPLWPLCVSLVLISGFWGTGSSIEIFSPHCILRTGNNCVCWNHFNHYLKKKNKPKQFDGLNHMAKYWCALLMKKDLMAFGFVFLGQLNAL